VVKGRGAYRGANRYCQENSKGKRSRAIETGFDRIVEFSEFRHGTHPEIHHCDPALFWFAESYFNSF
jgi:hypothetical protein